MDSVERDRAEARLRIVTRKARQRDDEMIVMRKDLEDLSQRVSELESLLVSVGQLLSPQKPQEPV